MSEITKYTAGGTEIALNDDIIKRYLVSGDANKVTDQEVTMFLELCRGQKLNPFLREAYLVKFGSSPAQLIVGKDVFVKRAKANPSFRGFRAGIIVERSDGSIEKRSGTFYTKEEKLVGGYCEVAIAGWDFPLEHTVSMAEFSKGTATWKTMPATMIRKVALVQALREAFSEDFQAMYSEEEMPVDGSKLDRNPVELRKAAQETFEKHHGTDYEVIDTISTDQARRMFAIAGDESLVRSVMTAHGYEHTRDISLDDYDAIVRDIEDAKQAVESPEVILDTAMYEVDETPFE